MTLDRGIQYALHKHMLAGMEKFGAKAMAGVVMEAQTGEILAMVSLPDFDGNVYWLASPEEKRNRATYALYEMGSTFKTFTLAAALNEGVTWEDKAYDIATPMVIGPLRITDKRALEKTLSCKDIYALSSNLGTARIVLELDIHQHRHYLEGFGLMDPLSIEVPETATPILSGEWGLVDSVSMSYGYGIAVSVLHLAAGTATVVNGGLYRDPTLMRQKIQAGKRVITQETSQKMIEMMRYTIVSKRGTGKEAYVEGYGMIGKTGTAKKLRNGVYTDTYIASFTAAFPYWNPKYVVVITIDSPTHGIDDRKPSGATTAAVIVKEFVETAGSLFHLVRSVKE